MSYFSDARDVIAGGVNSPVRAFAGVGGEPIFFKSASGAWLESEDGERYIDYVGSWGPMILGHGHPTVLEAVIETARNGLSFGAPSVLETRIAEKIREMVPSMQRLRMVSSGTEATMSAIRLARGHTGRDKIIKFEGCYHGHSDSLLIKAGSGALTLGVPSSPGVPAGLAEHTITLQYNDPDSVRAAFAELGDDIACVIVEPIAGNMNMVRPEPGFLETLREQCTAAGAVLILDEVMTGFRVAKGGAQSLFGIEPDLTTLGKIVGGGMPAAAFGGRADIMASIAPDGPVYQAGTLSGNPVAMAAGLEHSNSLTSRAFMKLWRNARRSSSKVWPRQQARPGYHLQPSTLVACSASYLQTMVRYALSHRSPPQTSNDSRLFSTACSPKACIWHRQRSKPASCRPRTATPRSIKRSRRLARSWRRFRSCRSARRRR